MSLCLITISNLWVSVTMLLDSSLVPLLMVISFLSTCEVSSTFSHPSTISYILLSIPPIHSLHYAVICAHLRFKLSLDSPYLVLLFSRERPHLSAHHFALNTMDLTVPPPLALTWQHYCPSQRLIQTFVCKTWMAFPICLTLLPNCHCLFQRHPRRRPPLDANQHAMMADVKLLVSAWRLRRQFVCPWRSRTIIPVTTFHFHNYILLSSTLLHMTPESDNDTMDVGYEFFNLLKDRSLYDQAQCMFVID